MTIAPSRRAAAQRVEHLNTSGIGDDFVAAHVGDSIRIKPTPVAALRRGGPRALRVLVFGGGPLVGWGLRDHNLGLPGHVADQLAAATRRGIEMDVIADADPVRRSAIEGIRGLRLWRYDAIVVVLGEPATKLSAQEHAYWTAELVRVLLVEGAAAAPLLVYDAGEITEVGWSRRAKSAARPMQLRRDVARRACAGSGRVRFGELAAPRRIPAEGRPYDSTQFGEWAEVVVHRLLQQFEATASAATPHASARGRSDDERLRQRALETLRLTRDASPRLERIVRTARELFGATGAAINIIDDQLQWSKVAVPALADMPRDESYCTHTVENDGLTLINDSLLDERVSNRPLAGELRFYAAYPIHSWDGYRIGALCVYADDPRKMRQADLEPLRELAGLVEQELWSTSLAGRRR